MLENDNEKTGNHRLLFAGDKENKLLVKKYKQMSEYLEKIRLLRKRKKRVVIAI